MDDGSLSDQTDPQPSILRQEGAEERLGPGERHGDLLLLCVGISGGVRVRCRPWLPECSKVWGALPLYLVGDAQARHIPPVL